jgi:N-6 DNA Methylase
VRALSASLRKQLETSVLAARHAAEGASRAAIEGLGVFADRRPGHLDAGQASLRNGLRAKWRQLGGSQELLVAECAYEQWHRLLFARFLAENGLLLHPEYKAPVTLADCAELAAELEEPDAWSVAARFAAEILPGIFRLDDPCVRLRLAPEGRHALEQTLEAIPSETFSADDALGWVYQFWQRDKKDEVNASERKISGGDLGPVTQLFTENYMVRFLLENSLGAWWVARYPDSPLVKGFDYLRIGDDGSPAAGSFDGWPERVADVTIMDPCCGSGHFLVEAFSLLWQMRAEEEKLAPVEAQDAVLRDNLFGLEIDARCVQIAMFSVALKAWKAGTGWRPLPVPNIACSGISVRAPVEEWKALAEGDAPLENALVRLHALFREADTLGSLIDPRRSVEGMVFQQRSTDDADWAEAAPLLERAAQTEGADPATAVVGAHAAAIARATALLSRPYVLVVTNPPFLTRQSQGERIRSFADWVFPVGSADLATTFLLRCVELTESSGTVATVGPLGWFFQPAYRRLRQTMLTETVWQLVARLGPRAFRAISGEIVSVSLTILSRARPPADACLGFLDAFDGAAPDEKDATLREGPIHSLRQATILRAPSHRVVLLANDDLPMLGQNANSRTGTRTGDNPHLLHYFWEHPALGAWRRLQSVPARRAPYAGREHVVLWEDGKGKLAEMAATGQASIQGMDAWLKRGVCLGLTGDLKATLYCGEIFDMNCGVIWPKSQDDLPAIWSYCSSPEFAAEVRRLDQQLKLTTKTLLQVPFDLDRWRKIAEEADPIEEPSSDDPTQWLFQGRIELSSAPLQVAVARLLGYRWPDQAESDEVNSFTDADGIVSLPSVAGELPAADRVQQVLAAAFEETWSPAMIKGLLAQSGSKAKNLADWIRDEFFKQHCSLFLHRPFVWHVWDGQRDGFSALVNYHRLDRKTLEKLTYTYLGQDWVERQRAEVRDEIAGAEARLAAALQLQQKLESILGGEAPFDIYVRWKEPHEQPIGWEPDLNDGVRLNIRPFVEAGVLRVPFNIHWRKDRGKNADGTERENDRHLTLAEKDDARKRAGRQ